jgi:hypothetical protein
MKTSLTCYRKHRPQMQTGDALQWSTSSALGWLIRKFSKADVNHTSLVVDVNEYNRKYQLEAIEQGIALTSISRRLKDFKGRVWWLPLKDELSDYRDTINQIAFHQVGIRYDYGSLFAQVFGRVSTDASKFFCSEFAYFCWYGSAIPMHNPTGMAPRPGVVPGIVIFKDAVKII